MKSFYQRVYDLVEQIPMGKVMTYGQIARILGSPRASRVVGSAVARAPAERRLPCHRVISSTGQLAPIHAFGGAQNQRMLLEMEGIPLLPDGSVDVSAYLWKGAGEHETGQP